MRTAAAAPEPRAPTSSEASLFASVCRLILVEEFDLRHSWLQRSAALAFVDNSVHRRAALGFRCAVCSLFWGSRVGLSSIRSASNPAETSCKRRRAVQWTTCDHADNNSHLGTSNSSSGSCPARRDFPSEDTRQVWCALNNTARQQLKHLCLRVCANGSLHQSPGLDLPPTKALPKHFFATLHWLPPQGPRFKTSPFVRVLAGGLRCPCRF